MYVLPVSEKNIKHWKSIQIPVPLSQVTANFKNLACPDPPNRILKDSPPTASPLEFLRKGKRVKERWTRGLSQLKCQPSSRLLITAHLRSKNPSADRISLLKKCRVEPVVKTASLVSTTSAGLRTSWDKAILDSNSQLRLGATHSVQVLNGLCHGVSFLISLAMQEPPSYHFPTRKRWYKKQEKRCWPGAQFISCL